MKYLLLGLLLFSSLAYANVYKCRDDAGSISYSHRPCPVNSQELAWQGGDLSVIEQDNRQRQEVRAYQRDRQRWAQQLVKQRRAKAVRQEQQAQWAAQALRKEKLHCQHLNTQREHWQRLLQKVSSFRVQTQRQKRLSSIVEKMQEAECGRFKGGS